MSYAARFSINCLFSGRPVHDCRPSWLWKGEKHVSPKTTYLLFQYYCCQIFILAAIMSWAMPFVASTSGSTYNSGLQATLVG